MAFGDIGGAVTELVLTCRAPASGTVAINKGDAVKLTGDYTVTNTTDAEDAVFGQALASAAENGAAIPVRVRGVCIFTYDGTAPAVNGLAGITAAAADGKVKTPATGNGTGKNLKADTANNKVHVLL